MEKTIEMVDLTPLGSLSLGDSNHDPVARKGQMVQGPWQWVMNDQLVAAAPLNPNEDRVIKTSFGQIYRSSCGQSCWEIFPTDLAESPRLVSVEYFQKNFAFVGKIDSLRIYRKRIHQRAMQFFPTLEVPRLLVHPDNLPQEQYPYELAEGDWLVNRGDSYYYWRRDWASRWVHSTTPAYQQNDNLIINPALRQEWISRAQQVFGERIRPSADQQVTILRDHQDCTGEAVIYSETDAVVAPWLITTKLQLACLRRLSPEEYYRIVTPYGTVMETKADRPQYLAWHPNDPRDMRILDQGAADNYHPVGRHGGFGILWRKVVPTLAFQVSVEQFPEGLRVVSKETPLGEAPLVEPGDYVVYDGDGGFYHWKQGWFMQNIEVFGE